MKQNTGLHLQVATNAHHRVGGHEELGEVDVAGQDLQQLVAQARALDRHHLHSAASRSARVEYGCGELLAVCTHSSRLCFQHALEPHGGRRSRGPGPF